jgi:T-complex protein 1 subunit zeta
LITEGYEIAKDMALEFLDAFKVSQPKIFQDRELLTNVVRTSLRTKLAAESADKMSDAIVDAMLAISEEGQPIDLHMVEVMQVTKLPQLGQLKATHYINLTWTSAVS